MKKIILTAVVAFLVGFAAQAQRVFMTGDSHVNSKIYPNTVEQILREEMPDLEFAYNCKVGTGFYTFNKSEELMKPIMDFAPEVLVVHLGTNDSYMKNFDPQRFLRTVTTFYDNIKAAFPECRLVFVSPFYNKLKDKTLNESTRACADAYVEFCNTHPDAYLIDNNAEHGMDFIDGGLIRKDFVHLTADGYKTLGEQVGNGLLQLDIFGSGPAPLNP